MELNSDRLFYRMGKECKSQGKESTELSLLNFDEKIISSF